MSSLEKAITKWFAVNKRDLPWRNSTPWGVMISEFMLQQTPVVRVLPKWNEWMRRWPTPQALAEATPAEVITAWGRLGYPRRALRLYETAIEISLHHGGEVPADQAELRNLPGIGEYTAAAIMAFAFGKPALVLDINVRRVFSRVLDGVQHPPAHITTFEKSLRSELIPEYDGAIWAAATMELGALICTARNPKCNECPIATTCRWKALGFPESLAPRTSQGWHGTDRKCRGTILQALRENALLSENALKALWNADTQVEKAIGSLVEDGLIALVERGFYSLPQSPPLPHRK